jgi:hypothetical protein
MLEAQQVEELICLVSAMDRQTLVRHFRDYRANFPVDFTDEFLEKWRPPPRPNRSPLRYPLG